MQTTTRMLWLCTSILTITGCASSGSTDTGSCSEACQIARRNLANDPIYQQQQRDIEAVQAQNEAEARSERRREFFQNLSQSLQAAQEQQHANYCAQLRNSQTANTNMNCYSVGSSTNCTGQTTRTPLPADCL